MRETRCIVFLFCVALAWMISADERLQFDFSPSPLSRVLARAEGGGTTLTCPRCAAPPTIDGALSDAAWKNASVIDTLLLPDGSTAMPRTQVHVCFDDEALYIGVTCDPAEGRALHAPERPQDKGQWQDDCIELWIAPDPKVNVSYQFIVTAGGSIYDAKRRGASGDESYDPEWQRAAQQDGGKWSVEMALPKKALGMGDWPARIGFNIGRNGPGLPTSDWARQYGDATQSSLLLQGIAEPAVAEEVHPTAARPALTVTIPRPYARPGERWIEATLHVSPGDRPLDGTRIRAAVFRLGEERPAAEADAVPDRGEGRLFIDVRTLKLHEGRLCVRLLDGEKLLDAKEVFISARDPETALQPGRKIPVRLDVPEGIGAVTAWPVTFGVPFAAGTLWDVDRLRLVDAKGAEIPCQKEVTGLWARDGAIQWVRFDALVGSSDGCFVEVAPAGPASKGTNPVRVVEQEGAITLDTGAARYVLAKGPSPIREIWLGGKRIAAAGSRGLYVTDQTGRTASASANGETMVIESRGPVAACVRFEGFYRTEKGEQLARHITRVEAFAGQPFAKITHTLVLSNDTNSVWFRDIGWEFSVEPGSDPAAVFGVSREEWAKSHCVPLAGDAAGAFMLQDRHYRFAHGDNHFLVGKLDPNGKAQTVMEGEKCGDWAALAGSGGALGVCCKEAARQHPKEFEVRRDRIVLHLFSNRGGEELDFRVPNLVERWDLANWYKNTLPVVYKKDAEATAKKVSEYKTNAIGWAKTHELLVVPVVPKQIDATVPRMACLLAHPVFASADPAWICGTEVLGSIHPRDTERFPRLEQVIQATFEVWEKRVAEWGEYGFVDYFAGPHLGYKGKYVVPFRYCPYTYTLRGDLWLIYARSSDRRIREFSEGTNRAYTDNIFCHWDGAGKIRGLYINQPGGDTSKGDNKHCLPFYWDGTPKMQCSSSSNLDNFILDYHLTGYRRAKDHVLEYIDGAKRFWTPARAKQCWRALMMVRLLAQAYGMTWDAELHAMASATTDTFVDPEGDLGLTKERPYRSSSYKTQVDIAAMLDAWRILGDPIYHELSLKISRYWWDNLLGMWPVFYTNPQGRVGNFLYRETGEPSYAQGLDVQIRQIATAYDPGTDTIIGKLRGDIGAEDSTFVFQGIPFGQDAVVRSGADRAPATSWVGCGDFGYPVSIVVFKPDNGVVTVDVKTEAGLSRAKDTEGLTGGVRVRAVAAPTASGLDLNTVRASSSGFATVHIPKDAPEGGYEILPETQGRHFALAHSKAPLVVYAPEFWRPQPAQYPPVRWFFNVPEGSKDAQIFFEVPARLFGPDGKPWPKEEAVSGWIDLPSDRPGLWGFEAVEHRLVRVRNVPPFFAAGDPKHYFTPEIPWEREPIPPPPKEVPPGTIYLPGAIETPGNQALLLTGRRQFRLESGPEHPSGDGGLFLPFQQGTVEFYFKPVWSTFDLPDGRSRTLFQMLSTDQPWRLSYLKDLSKRDWMASHVLYGYFYSDGPRRRITVRAYRRALLLRDEWAHIAWVWGARETADFKKKSRTRVLTARIFVNGKEGQQYSYTWEDQKPADLPKTLLIGPSVDAAYDELRVSDVQRYTGDFVPPARDREFQVDPHTRALFHFNGDVKGESYGFEGELPAALKE